MSRRDHRRTGERGQALVEFAFVAPLLVILLTAIAQLAIIFERQIGIENAIREDGRRAAAFVTTDANVASHADWALNELICLPTGNPADACYEHSSLLADNVQAYSSDSSTLSSAEVCYRPSGVDADGNPILDPTGQVYATIDVSVSYRHPLFVPLISGLLDGFDGATDGALRIDTTIQFRVENMRDDNGLTPVLTFEQCAP